MQKDLLYVILSGFASGIFFRSFFDFGFYFVLFSFLMGLIFLFSSLFQKNIKFFLLSLGIFFIFFGLGIFRLDFEKNINKNSDLENIVGEKVSARVLVIDEPDVRENNTRLTVLFKEVFYLGDQVIIGKKEKAIIVANHYPQFNYGDEILLIGFLKKPKNFETNGGRYFDYVSYLDKDGIAYEMFYPKTELVSGGNGNLIKEKIFLAKNSFLQNLEEIIPQPHSALLGGLVVGAKQSLGKDWLDKFRKVGLTHIIVLSGYNISIISDSILSLLNFLPFGISIFLGSFGIILFAVMTGASATIVRASIMALLVIFARATGRSNDIKRALFFAGLVMLVHNPKILVFDPSFQLSFAATLGLVYLSPKLENYFSFVTSKFGFREIVSATVATQIFVLPLILYMTGDISVLALVVNLLVLVCIPVTMLFGFLAGLFSFVSGLLAIPFAYGAYFFLAYILKIVDIFASFPFVIFSVSSFSFGWVIFVYCLYFWFLRYLNQQHSLLSSRVEEKIPLKDD